MAFDQKILLASISFHAAALFIYTVFFCSYSTNMRIANDKGLKNSDLWNQEKVSAIFGSKSPLTRVDRVDTTERAKVEENRIRNKVALAGMETEMLDPIWFTFYSLQQQQLMQRTRHEISRYVRRVLGEKWGHLRYRFVYLLISSVSRLIVPIKSSFTSLFSKLKGCDFLTKIFQLLFTTFLSTY